jgi:hypothetical protein
LRQKGHKTQCDFFPTFTSRAADPIATETKVPVIFSGGHDTYGPDRGRPVILIAAALKVTPEVFREAFSHVHPAPAGESPQPDQVRQNKKALMDALGPLGVTDDRLNEVSNHYRYRRQNGEMWPIVQATAYATVNNGQVTGFTITNSGSGYSSPPTVTLKDMPDVKAATTLSFDTDFSKNGSVKEIALPPPPK